MHVLNFTVKIPFINIRNVCWKKRCCVDQRYDKKCLGVSLRPILHSPHSPANCLKNFVMLPCTQPHTVCLNSAVGERFSGICLTTVDSWRPCLSNANTQCSGLEDYGFMENVIQHLDRMESDVQSSKRHTDMISFIHIQGKQLCFVGMSSWLFITVPEFLILFY